MQRKQSNDRKQLRLSNHDYSSSCVYFVTICVDWYVECLGSIHAQTTELNRYGKIIEQQWLWLAKQYPYISLDEFVIMPNHIHGIIIIDNQNDARDVNLRDGRDRPLPASHNHRPLQTQTMHKCAYNNR